MPATYAALRREVEVVVVQGRRDIDRAWLHTYHETGRLIHEHILLNKGRADYGAQVFARLAADTGISKRTLHECAQFYRCFPIVRDRAQLGWAHYRLLCQVPDPARREALLAEALKLELTSPQLEQRVRALAPPAADTTDATATSTSARSQSLVPKRGTPGLHLVVDRGDGPAIDLGFKLYRPLDAAQARRFAKADIVRLAADGSVRRVDDATKADLFTYAAALRRVVDGDTLVVALEIAPGIFIEQKLRLRGLDCPELSTPEGRAAKRFVEALLARATGVVINTTKPDKYDRYLADVFLAGASELSADVSAEEDLFLNSVLLAAGHAVRKDAWQFRDWEPDLPG